MKEKHMEETLKQKRAKYPRKQESLPHLDQKQTNVGKERKGLTM